MIKVIQDNSRKRCRCGHCDSVLEYNMKDVIVSPWLGEKFSYIKCPVCNTLTYINIKK